VTEELRSLSDFGRVTCGFLDEEPRIGSVLAAIEESTIVVVPFFVAEGWHTRDTIPSELGLSGSVTKTGGRTIWYTAPVGTMPEIPGIIVQTVDEVRQSHLSPPSSGGTPSPIRRARDAFLNRLRGAGRAGLDVMQAAIRPVGDQFELLNRDDRERPAGSLVRFARARVALGIANTTDRGLYRPLRSAGDLRKGWVIGPLSAEELVESIELLYPAAILHSYQETEGQLEVVTFHAWAGRQSGQYEMVRTLENGQVGDLVESLCGLCLKRRIWSIDPGEEPTMTLVPVSPGSPEVVTVPCREPCTLFATRAREVMLNVEC
jgi:sirohydrochlorin cobaltochelatase